MSLFNRSGGNPQQPISGGIPSGPRAGRGMPQPPPPDPSRALFERRPVGGGAPAPSQPNYRSQDYGGTPPGGYSSRRGGGSSRVFAVTPSPTDADSRSNRLIVYPGDFPQGAHVLVKGTYAVTTQHDTSGTIRQGMIGANQPQRQWMELNASGDEVEVDQLDLNQYGQDVYLTGLDIELGTMKPRAVVEEELLTDDVTKVFMKCFGGMVFSPKQVLLFEYHGYFLKATIKFISNVGMAATDGRPSLPFGVLIPETDVTFVKASGANLKLKGSSKKAPPNAILAPNFKFEDVGIGGLDSEFAAIFRRAFASRVFPPGIVDKLGIQHVRGLLLYGPPGTGKTLMARQIGKMLNAREPKIVNGPEILSKYVGASEENIRKLFEDAEKEYKEKGDESGLHILIFDELDAICKQRGSTNSGTGVGDTVVNQLLSKMDGVDQLNNILIIGMTNRKDMIDEALLRPGRLEVHMEISLPDEKGRLQILTIHTAKMRQNNVMDRDVDLLELAAITKNFSGAEIGGLIKSATSFAFQRHVKVGTMAGISEDVDKLRVNRDDFMLALTEVQPAFGVSEEELQAVIQNGIIHYDDQVESILHRGRLLVDQVRTSTRTPLVSVLLHGLPGTGKTALAATIAVQSEYPFIKLLSPETMVGFSEGQKVQAINKVFTDSYKSPLSVIVIDNIERLIDWVKIGSRFSNSVVQALMVLLGRRPPKGRRLLIIATTSNPAMLSELEVTELFDTELRVAPITALLSLEHVLKEVQLFPTSDERRRVMQEIEQAFRPRDQEQYDTGETTLSIGVKKLLGLTEMALQDPAGAGKSLVSILKEQAMGYNGSPPQATQPRRIKAEETPGPLDYYGV